jgi:hypothetical protein
MSRVREACNEILRKLGVDSLSKEEARRVDLMTDDAALVYTMDKMMGKIDYLEERCDLLERKVGIVE